MTERKKEERQQEQEQVKAEEDIVTIYQKPEAAAPETEKTQPAPEEPTA